MSTEIDPSQVDLVATKICPSGIKVTIEGIGTYGVQIPGASLLDAVCHAYVMLTGKTMIAKGWRVELTDCTADPPAITAKLHWTSGGAT